MALPTIDQADRASVPVGHSVDDHLAAERVALVADLEAAEARATRDERWRMIRAAGLGIALAGTIAFGWSRVRPEPEPARFCPADGYVAENGADYHRDPAQGCAWVDADGTPVPVDAEGRPTG